MDTYTKINRFYHRAAPFLLTNSSFIRKICEDTYIVSIDNIKDPEQNKLADDYYTKMIHEFFARVIDNNNIIINHNMYRFRSIKDLMIILDRIESGYFKDDLTADLRKDTRSINVGDNVYEVHSYRLGIYDVDVVDKKDFR